MPILIALAVTLVLGSVLITVATKKKGNNGGRQKGRTAIIRDATRKLAQNPHNPEGLIPLGNLYFNEKNWEKAYPLYDTMHNVYPAHPQIDPFIASQRLGICAVKMKRPQDALRGLSDAHKLRPADFETNFNLGLCFYDMGEFEKALPFLRQSIAANPDASTAYEPLGMALYKGKHYRESLPYLKKALDFLPDSKELLYSMANAMQEANMGEKAMKVFMHLRPDPEFGAKSCLQAGLMHTKINEWDKAIQDFEIGMKHQNVEPEIALELRYRLALAYFAVKNISKGINCLYEIQSIQQNYRDVPQLISRYAELNQNKNLQIYIMASQSDFISLCRNFVSTYHQKSRVKISEISVQQDCVEISAMVSNAKWEDNELFRFYRSQGVTGELYIRDLHSKLSDTKSDRGFCITCGHFSEEARKYVEGRPIDLIEKETLTKILKKVNIAG